MAYHKDLVEEHLHSIIRWEFADTASRAGVSDLVATDVGKVAWQKDNDTYWILKNNVGPVWNPTLNINSKEISMEDQLLIRPKLKDVSETINSLGTLTGGTTDINIELGNIVTATISTAEQTFTFSNPPVTGSNGSFVLYLTNGGSQTVNWPATLKWTGGTAPTLTSAGLDVLVFSTNTGGASWYGFVAGLDVK